MTEKETTNEKAVKMQKLRHAVERLRNSRAYKRNSDSQKQSWLARLRARLRL